MNLHLPKKIQPEAKRCVRIQLLRITVNKIYPFQASYIKIPWSSFRDKPLDQLATCNESFNVISNSNYSSLLRELTGTRSPLLIIVSVCGSRFGLSLNGSSVSGFGRCCCGRGDGVCGGGKMAGDIERDLFLGGLPVLRQ